MLSFSKFFVFLLNLENQLSQSAYKGKSNKHVLNTVGAEAYKNQKWLTYGTQVHNNIMYFAEKMNVKDLVINKKIPSGRIPDFQWKPKTNEYEIWDIKPTSAYEKWLGTKQYDSFDKELAKYNKNTSPIHLIYHK